MQRRFQACYPGEQATTRLPGRSWRPALRPDCLQIRLVVTNPSKFIAHKIREMISNGRLFSMGGSDGVAGRRADRTDSARDR